MADYKAVKLMHCWNEYCFPSGWGSIFAFCYLVVGGGAWWGKATCAGGWGWAWEALCGSNFTEDSVCVCIGGWGAGISSVWVWNAWCSSYICFRDVNVTARWWCRSSNCCAGGNSGNWCAWGTWWTYRGGWGWWVKWGGGNGWSYGWWPWWLWITYCWMPFAWWWWGGTCCTSACIWMGCCWWWNGWYKNGAGTSATTCWSGWWGSWCASSSWAWAWWVAIISYPEDWRYWFTCATWWDCCFTCCGYCVHRFNSNWTFTIVS